MTLAKQCSPCAFRFVEWLQIPAEDKAKGIRRQKMACIHCGEECVLTYASAFRVGVRI